MLWDTFGLLVKRRLLANPRHTLRTLAVLGMIDAYAQLPGDDMGALMKCASAIWASFYYFDVSVAYSFNVRTGSLLRRIIKSGAEGVFSCPYGGVTACGFLRGCRFFGLPGHSTQNLGCLLAVMSCPHSSSRDRSPRASVYEARAYL
jgi:hypothetical protein